ncbi:MAG TPA: MarR family transcriptional regulator [Clostridia bacterium]|nr:MarR family transcriptional regulator [Clostridia bacterium]
MTTLGVDTPIVTEQLQAPASPSLSDGLGKTAELQPLKALLTEVNALAIAMKQTAARFQQEGDLPPGARSVLEILEHQGDQSVPSIARIRFTSRQNIQILVNGLIAEGCVELRDNPAHKRSSLVHLADKGRSLLTAGSSNETGLLSSLASHVSEQEITQATELLRELRRLMTGETKKQPAVRGERKPAKEKPQPSSEAQPRAIAPGTTNEAGPGEAQQDSSELPVNLL